MSTPTQYSIYSVIISHKIETDKLDHVYDKEKNASVYVGQVRQVYAIGSSLEDVAAQLVRKGLAAERIERCGSALDPYP